MNTATRITLLICLLLLPFAVLNLMSWTGAFTVEFIEPIGDFAITVLPWLAGIWFIFGRGGRCCGRRTCGSSRKAAPSKV